MEHVVTGEDAQGDDGGIDGIIEQEFLIIDAAQAILSGFKGVIGAADLDCRSRTSLR